MRKSWQGRQVALLAYFHNCKVGSDNFELLDKGVYLHTLVWISKSLFRDIVAGLNAIYE